MKKENFEKIKPDKSLVAKKGDYFVGKTILHDISEAMGVRDQKIYYAGFKNGARTKLHYHGGSQTLVVTHGIGMLVLYRKTSQRGKRFKVRQSTKSNLRKGDIVYIPRNTMHWHGASKGKDFGHIAFNGFSRGREAKTIWFDSDFKSLAIRLV